MLSKTAQAYGQIQSCLIPILEGTLVAIDPSIGSSSSMPGYAIYRAGILEESGILSIDSSGTIWQRLRMVVHQVRKLYQQWDPDVLIFEDIPPQRHGGDASAHASLIKAVGAIISVSGPDYVVGLHPRSWKLLVRPSYTKSDENDAIEMGWIAVQEARRINETDPPGKKYGKKTKSKKAS